MYEDGKIIVNTTTDRVKYRNILRDPRISFLIYDGYPYIMMLGRARIATERNGKKDIETLAIRYTGEEAGSPPANVAGNRTGFRSRYSLSGQSWASSLTTSLP